MCDTKKIKTIYNEIKKLEPEDTLQLLLEAETKDEQEFYEIIGNFLLKKRQREVIEANKF